MQKLTPQEIQETHARAESAEANLACEGIFLTEEEKAYSKQLIDAGWPHEKRLEMVLNRFIYQAGLANQND